MTEEIKEATAKAKGIHTAHGGLDQEVWFHGTRHANWYKQKEPPPPIMATAARSH